MWGEREREREKEGDRQTDSQTDRQADRQGGGGGGDEQIVNSNNIMPALGGEDVQLGCPISIHEKKHSVVLARSLPMKSQTTLTRDVVVVSATHAGLVYKR